ncbi:MAG: Cell surface protein precursor [Pelotomaculum sp. PtaB.Bin104]|nr:MAG: Cell surface protein precursor [Pelotomaculum sp. PtaB.Bin104]
MLLSLLFVMGVCAAGEAANAAGGTVWGTGTAKAGGVEAPAAEQGAKLGTPVISRDRAVEIAREMFPEMLDGKDLDVELSEYMGRTKTWRLNWSGLLDSGRRVEHISVMLDAETGALVNMYCNSATAGDGIGAAVVSREAALQKAEEYAKKFRPAEFARTRPANENYFSLSGMMGTTYAFVWERGENGIPVKGDGIHVGIDVYSGKLANFSVNWHDDAVFPQPGALPEGLEARVLQELGLMLCYQVTEAGSEDPSGVPGASLVYQLNSLELKIDPSSEEALTPEGRKTPIGQYKLFSGLPAPSGGIDGVEPLVSSPSSGRISQADAQKKAEEFFKKLGLEGEVTRNGEGGGNDGIFFYESMNFGLKNDERPTNGVERRSRSVDIDTRTGDVMSYQNSSSYDGRQDMVVPEKTISADAARAKALEMIKLIHPERLETLLEKQRDDIYEYGFNASAMTYNFHFARLVNGVPFLRDGIWVAVDAGGEVVSYDCKWHEVRFPSTAGIITGADAEKAFLENMRLKFAYYYPSEKSDLRRGIFIPELLELPSTESQPALCLVFDENLKGIDAVTGQPLALEFGGLLPWTKDLSAIPAGHWAYNALTVLATSGLLPSDGFDPDGPVSSRDAVRALMSATESSYQSYRQSNGKISYVDVTPKDRDYAVIQAAVRRGVLEDGERFLPDQPVAREELVVWLVRALGYGEIAGMPARIELNAPDADLASEKARNYVAIAYGLGLARGDANGFFRPDDPVTWAELASLVTRATPRLRAVNY